jgi:hypothetical protein
MKVALLLAGHPRTYEQTFLSFQQNILNIYPNLDIFIWCWDELGYWTPNNPDGSVPEYGVYNKSGYVNKDKLLDMYKPKKYCIQSPKDHKEKIESLVDTIVEKRYPHVRPFNNMSCWYSLYNADLLRRQYEEENNFKYDVVIRWRFDIIIERPLVISDRFTIPTDIWGDPVPHGYDDVCFYGSSETMKNICDLIVNVVEVAKNNPQWDSHSAFKYWVDKHYPNFEYRKFGVTLTNTPGGYCKTESLPI